VSTITITLDGQEIRCASGITVAAALLDERVQAFRRSNGGEARGPLCGMGICYECRVTVDGVAHRRACLVPVRDGMLIATASD
jgi:D-hydroxyproline dehydrogenase subunit gamma